MADKRDELHNATSNANICDLRFSFFLILNLVRFYIPIFLIKAV